VENLYINGIIEGLKNSLEAQQRIVFHEKVLAGDNDLRSHMTKLKRLDCDVIGVLLYAGQVQTFYKNLKGYDIEKPTFGSDFMESRAEIKASGPSIQGAIYPHLSISDEYYRMYRDEYQSDSQVTSSGSAYDLAMILGELHKKDDHFYESVFDKLNALNSYRGVMGEYTYDQATDSVKRFYPPVHLKIIKDNFYELLK
jgi:ABC-type branched-subunit amino acid transport system substrate-binding protein